MNIRYPIYEGVYRILTINVIQLFAQPSTKYGLSYEQLSNPISNL